MLLKFNRKRKTSNSAVFSPFQSIGAQRAARERELIQRESKIGATLFGPIPVGHTREFFNLDRYTWVWFEEWYDINTKTTKSMNVRYEFQTSGVLKIVDNVPSGYVVGQELVQLLTAIYTYEKRVMAELYNPALAAA